MRILCFVVDFKSIQRFPNLKYIQLIGNTDVIHCQLAVDHFTRKNLREKFGTSTFLMWMMLETHVDVMYV